jgi:AraC-like DNA-binding protein
MSVRLFRPFYAAIAKAYRERGNSVGQSAAFLLQEQSERWNFADPETRIPYQEVYRLLDAAIADTADTQLGLHAAELIEPQDLHVLYYAASSCANLEQAAQTLSRYFKLVNESGVFGLRVDGDRAVWEFTTAPGVEPHYASTEYVLAATLISTRRMMKTEEGALIEVRFTHPRPADTREHERIFRAPLRFDAEENAFIFPAEFLQAPVPGADTHLCAILQSHADRMLAELPSTDRFGDQVRELVLAELRGGNPNLDRIADCLGASPSTVRRRLAEEGTTHRELLDDLRRRLALRYLEQDDLILSEIAFLLGFSHENAFRKAFKRWTGKSPAGFRKGSRTTK